MFSYLLSKYANMTDKILLRNCVTTVNDAHLNSGIVIRITFSNEFLL